MSQAHVWYPSAGGSRVHALPADRTIVSGWALTVCSPDKPLALSRDTAGPDLPRCSNCDRSIAAVCGTYGGYKRHKKRGERACAPCRKANADYLRRYRADNPTSAERNNTQGAARSRAMTRLAAEFPDRFRVLFEEELRAGTR